MFIMIKLFRLLNDCIFLISNNFVRKKKNPSCLADFLAIFAVEVAVKAKEHLGWLSFKHSLKRSESD